MAIGNRKLLGGGLTGRAAAADRIEVVPDAELAG